MNRYLTLLLLFGLLMTGCGQTSTTPPAITADSGTANASIARVVYLFNSVACPCEANRTKEADGVVQDVLAEGGTARPFERIDVTQHAEMLANYQRQTQFAFMPVLLGLDAKGQVVAKVEGFFKPEAARAILIVP